VERKILHNFVDCQRPEIAMELREMIEAAAKVSGDQKKLAKAIGTQAGAITEAKAGRRGLPTLACYKLAAILELDPAVVVAASELVTEKNPEKRAVFAPFVHELPRKAAAWMMAAASAATIGSIAPTDTYANDTFNVSSPAPQPAPLQGFASNAICIM
jgi:hypothetical protein